MGFLKKKGSLFIAYVSDCDFDALSKYKWYLDNKGYPSAKIKLPCGHYQNKTMHKMIITEKRPKATIDHIDRNKLNNQRENLRICSHRKNILNRGLQKNNTSGFRGVKINKGLILSQIGVHGKTIFLGTFKTRVDAVLAYDEAAIKYNGPNTTTNKSLGLLD